MKKHSILPSVYGISVSVYFGVNIHIYEICLGENK